MPFPPFLRPRRPFLNDDDELEQFRTPPFVEQSRRPRPTPPRVVTQSEDWVPRSPVPMERPDSIAPVTPNRADVPIPQLPGRVGGPRPYDPMTAAQYDYVMEGTRNNQGDIGNKVRRSGKDIALAALAGLGRGGLVGAATGALGATISPTLGREMNFDAFHAPQIQAEMERGQQQQGMERQRALQDIAMQRGTLGLEQDQTETEMLRQKMRDFPEEMKSVRDERAARAKEREANIKRLLNPVPRARNVYIDREGLQRDRDTNEIMRDPTTGQPIYGKEDATPFSSSGLGIFDTRSGRVTTPAPERESPEDRYERAENKRQNMAADREIVRHNTLKSKAAEFDAELAVSEGELAKINQDKNPDEWAKANEAVTRAQVQYDGAKSAMEEHWKQAAEANPELLEGGSGGADRRGKPWGFLKKQERAMSRPSSGGTGRKGIVGETHIQAVMQALNQPREQAIQSLRNDGYEVR